MSSKNYGPTVKYFVWFGTKSLSFKVIHAILCGILMLPGLELFVFNSNVLARIEWVGMMFGVFGSFSYILIIMTLATLGVAWFLLSLGSIIEHKRYVYLRIESYKRLGLDYSLYRHWTNEESKLWLRGRYPNLKGVQMSQSEERRQTRKKVSVLRGILYVVIGFTSILIWLFLPISNRTGSLYILSVLCNCVIGVACCYWALNEFLSAYKEKDALMNVYIMTDFHIGHFQGKRSLIDSHIARSYFRGITDPKKQTIFKIPPYDA